MDESNETMTPDKEVGMIFTSDKDDGPSTSKRARIKSNDQATSSYDDDDDSDHEYFQRRACDRSIGHRRQTSDDSSDSLDASSSVDIDDAKVYQNVDAYLESIPEFDVSEHRRIPSYMKLLGSFANQIETDLPRSDNYTDQQMEKVRKNFILSQLDFLVRENVRRTTQEAQKETKRISSVKPLANVARRERH